MLCVYYIQRVTNLCIVRDEAAKDADIPYEDEDGDNDWSGRDVEWSEQDASEGPEVDVTDESSAYIEFLHQEVCSLKTAYIFQPVLEY